jgi:hypothetical protein
MKLTRQTAVVLVALFAGMPLVVAAQEPVTSFDLLNTRLRPGDTVWVTDTQGLEIHGKIQSLSPRAVTLDAGGARTLAAADVSVIRERERDSVRNGTLIGLGVGGSLALAWCVGAVADDSGSERAGVECAEGLVVYAGLGTLLGAGIDAVIPGKMRVAYRAPGVTGASATTRVSILPVVARRTAGIAVSLSF